MVSPHISPLASALAKRFEQVRVVTLSGLDPKREAIGWGEERGAAFEQVHAVSEQDRWEVIRSSGEPDDLHVLPGLKPASWLRSIQRELGLSQADIAIMSEGPRRDGGWPKLFAVNLRDRLLARQWRDRVRGVFATGEEAVAHYVAVGFPPRKVHPFGYFPSLRGANVPIGGAQGAVPQIGVAAKLEPYKGLDLLLKALARLKHREWRLRVAGDGWQRVQLQNLARDLGLEGRIEWLGWRSFDLMPEFLSASDLVVLPSRYDGWGAVVNESLGAGTPVVASDGVGAHCLLVHPQIGSTFATGNVAAMTEAISFQFDQPITVQRRAAIMNWANRALSADAAADYFCSSLEHDGRSRPPWLAIPFVETRSCAE